MNSDFSNSDFYDLLLESLMFLENMATQGFIRYYGISSNVLSRGGISIQKILEKTSNLPNFKILQFPYNFVENHASDTTNGNSLIDICKSKGIKTIANRPLNTKFKENVLRIANYENSINEKDILIEQRLFDRLLNLVSIHLKKMDASLEPSDFPTLTYLVKRRKELANPEAVSKVINDFLIPFIQKLQLDSNMDIAELLKQLRIYWKNFSLLNINKHAQELKSELITKGEIKKEDTRDLSLIACEEYLNRGINHVLVGMRKKEYIDKLKPVF